MTKHSYVSSLRVGLCALCNDESRDLRALMDLLFNLVHASRGITLKLVMLLTCISERQCPCRLWRFPIRGLIRKFWDCLHISVLKIRRTIGSRVLKITRQSQNFLINPRKLAVTRDLIHSLTLPENKQTTKKSRMNKRIKRTAEKKPIRNMLHIW